MQSYCKYHPLESAIWQNQRTNEFYCEKCVDGAGDSSGYTVATSLASREDLHYLGGANSAAPFWEVLPEIFYYPLHKNSAIFLAVLFSLGALLLQFGGPVSLLVLLLLLAAITQYGFAVIASTAAGDDSPPKAMDAMKGSFELLGKKILVQLIFGVFIYAVGKLGSPLLNFSAFALVVFVLPASLMMFTLEDDITSAVNPSALLGLIGHIGWGYLLLFIFLFVLSGSSIGFVVMLSDDVSESTLLIILAGSALYSLLVAYRLMGYTIFQYQGVLGFVSEDQKNKVRRRKSSNTIDAKVEVLVKEGRYENALKLLRKEVTQRPGRIHVHENLSKLLKVMGDMERWQTHGHLYMKVAFGLGDDSRLYFLYCQYHDADSGFIPEAPEVRHRLAEQFSQRGKYKEGVALLANLHKDAPNYLEVPNAYLLMATMLFEGLADANKALQYLGFIRKNYPDSSCSNEVIKIATKCKDALV